MKSKENLKNDVLKKTHKLDTKTSPVDKKRKKHCQLKKRVQGNILVELGLKKVGDKPLKTVAKKSHYNSKFFKELKKRYSTNATSTFTEIYKRTKTIEKADALITEKVAVSRRKRPQVTILARDEAYGKALVYDHIALQTGSDAKMYIAKNPAKSARLVSEAFRQVGYEIKNPPLILKPGETHLGLITITGASRRTIEKRPDDYQKRFARNFQSIRQARYTGQPIMAICAGSWELYRAWKILDDPVTVLTDDPYFDLDKHHDVLKPVKDHSYGGGMPRVNNRAKVTHNKLIHGIVINPKHQHSVVATAMQLSVATSKPVAQKTLRQYQKTANVVSTPIPVNSLHWKAIRPELKPSNCIITSYSVDLPDIAPKSRQSIRMQPERCAESFETEFGAPCIGIQWHPEAFVSEKKTKKLASRDVLTHFKKHIALKRYMMFAGKTYSNRIALNKEFKHKIRDKKSFPLKKTYYFTGLKEVRNFSTPTKKSTKLILRERRLLETTIREKDANGEALKLVNHQHHDELLRMAVVKKTKFYEAPIKVNKVKYSV